MVQPDEAVDAEAAREILCHDTNALAFETERGKLRDLEF